MEINKLNTVRDSHFLNDRSSDTVRKIGSYITKKDRILDIGSGGGHVAHELKALGYHITTLDIKNKSYFDDVRPVTYDGRTIPFPDDHFDVSLLLTVLHHTEDPISILAEAKRVSKKIIIIEDLHKNVTQKYLTFIMDSVLNREFFGHPHSNKTKAEWESSFKEMGLTILDEKTNDWGFKYLPAWFTSGTFYLKK
jgi:ubiquinone/menaquinone biosynthesis C-methylase UbiE